MASNWLPRRTSPRSEAPAAGFARSRRRALQARFPGATLVIPAGTAPTRSNDTEYPFRPHSAFAHLTGWGADSLPGSVLLISAQGAALFAPGPFGRTDPGFYTDAARGEFWTGPVPGAAEIGARLGLPVLDVAGLPAALAASAAPLVLRGADAAVDAFVPVADPAAEDVLAETTSEARLVKDGYEIAELRRAVAASRDGFDEIIRSLPRIVASPRGERVAEGVFWTTAREQGNDVGYTTIAAAGEHACCLHWTRNDGRVDAGDLLLVDAGVELDSLYTADVTRTLPVSGRFSPVQRRVYDAVLAAADAAFAAARPGVRFRDVHDAAMAVIGRTVTEWGLLPGPPSPEDAAAQLFRRFMVHGTSHHLGLDVHDCAQARREMYLDAPLRPGMVFTIEPGLYFHADDALVPPELRGIGVRIEDDILVTETGVERLTAAIPRTGDGVEQWMASLRYSSGAEVPRMPRARSASAEGTSSR